MTTTRPPSGGTTGGPVRGLFWAAIALLLFLPATLLAKDVVDGGYMTINGREIHLRLQIGVPPPTTLIVTQQLPPDTGIRTSSPLLKNYNAGLGLVKWLISDVKPGPLDIQLTLASAVQKKAVSCIVRYRHPVNGIMTTLEITPP